MIALTRTRWTGAFVVSHIGVYQVKGGEPPQPPSRIYTVPYEDTTYIVPCENMTYPVPYEDTTYIVPFCQKK